jgi:hypothetical protein
MRFLAMAVMTGATILMVGQRAQAADPTVITLACDGTLTDTSSSTAVPVDHQPKPMEKLGVVVNLNAGTVSFLGWNVPISTVDPATIGFGGNDVGPVGQITDKTGYTSRVDGTLDRVTGRMVADAMTYETKNSPIPPAPLSKITTTCCAR